MSCGCGGNTTGNAMDGHSGSGGPCRTSQIASTGGSGPAVGAARLAWRDGQLLAAQDLRDEMDRDARLRQLHVRHQHGTWGVALGFGVSLEPGGASVVVGPGHALDALGRDLVLASALRLPVPPADGWLALAARAPSESAPAPERPAFRWLPVADLERGRDVALAAAQVAQGHVVGTLDGRVRRHAHQLARPRIAAGATEPGGTAWTEVGPTGDVRFLEVEVGTEEAGFLSRPRYVAVLEPPPGTGPAPLSHRPLAWIAAAGAASFTFQVAAGALPFALDLDADTARRQGWTVSWLGLEPWAGAEPSPGQTPLEVDDVATLLALFGAGPLGGDCP